MGLGLVLRDVSAANAAAICKVAEDVGFDAVFFPETGHLPARPVTGRDPFVVAQAVLAATSSLKAGPGVAVTVFRPARQMAIAAASLNECSGGRFLLGCGVSHADLLSVEGSQQYPESPIGHISSYCDQIRSAADWIPSGRPGPVLVGALGVKMIAAAVAHADGVILNWVTSSLAGDTARSGRGEAGDDWSSYAFVRVGSREALRSDAESYRETLSNYRRHFERQGLRTSDEVIDATCIVGGDAARIVDRLEQYREEGLGTPCLYPVGMTLSDVDRMLRAMAVRMEVGQ